MIRRAQRWRGPSRPAAALAVLLLAACGQNYSEKPAAQALAEANLSAVGGAPHAPAAAPHPAPAPSAGSGLQSLGDVSVAVPEGWKSVPPTSSMRVAEYQIPPARGAEGSNLAVFAGNWGSIDDNVNRWYGQFTQPDGSDTAAKARRWGIETEAGLAVTMVDVSGTYSSGMAMGGGGGGTSGSDYRMLGAIVDTGGRFYYLKLTGPTAEIAALAAPFEQMVRSLRKG